MEHHDWDWSDGHGDGDNAETADLGGDPGHELGFDGLGDHGLGDHDLGDHFGGVADADHDFGAHDATLPDHDDVHGHDAIEEPLGTEDATAHYDESLAHSSFGEPHDVTPVEDHAASFAGDDHQPLAGVGDDGHVESQFGADPDTDHHADDGGWDDHAFPPDLGLHAPEPVDGFPWTDPSALGADGAADDFTHSFDGSSAPAADLAAYDGVEVPPGTDAWSALLGSDDPATSTLARWWAPGN
jgi:hypothetical protein